MDEDNKLRDLNFEYWGRVHDMCAGTDVKPWSCVKHDGECYLHGHPQFNSELYGYEFAVAILKDDHTGKGRPVWIGDEIYDKEFCEMVRIDRIDKAIGLLFDDQGNVLRCFPDDYCWHPINGELTPTTKPKRTFTLNGVELPCPVDNLDVYEIFISVRDGVSDRCTNRFSFQTELDARKVFDAMSETLESAERNA